MFLGEYYSKVDKKNRFIMPSKFYGKFNSDIVYLTKLKEYILLNTEERFMEILSAYERICSFDESASAKGFLSNTIDVKMDSNRRVIIPKYMLESLGIESEISLLGMNNYIELWNRSVLDENMNKVASEYDNVLRLLTRC